MDRLLPFFKERIADISVDMADVTDEDHWPQRIQDLQEAHLDTEPSEYPLISKEKSLRNSRTNIVDFCDSLVASLHESSLLYNTFAPGLKAEVWLNIMSSISIEHFNGSTCHPETRQSP